MCASAPTISMEIHTKNPADVSAKDVGADSIRPRAIDNRPYSFYRTAYKNPPDFSGGFCLEILALDSSL